MSQRIPDSPPNSLARTIPHSSRHSRSVESHLRRRERFFDFRDLSRNFWRRDKHVVCEITLNDGRDVLVTSNRSYWRRWCQVTGVGRTRAGGNPTDFQSGNISSRPITAACTPNEVNVVQLWRVRWPDEVSSMQSANIVSSSLKSVCWYGHRAASRSPRAQNKKGRVFTRPAGTFWTPEVSLLNYFCG